MPCQLQSIPIEFPQVSSEFSSGLAMPGGQSDRSAITILLVERSVRRSPLGQLVLSVIGIIDSRPMADTCRQCLKFRRRPAGRPDKPVCQELLSICRRGENKKILRYCALSIDRASFEMTYRSTKREKCEQD